MAEIPMLDHLVYATPDLEATARDLGDCLGVTPVPGGQHLGRGTRNYLLGLGGGSYLELIGPDPEQPDFSDTRPLGLDSIDRPRLIAWALRITNIDEAIESARTRGYDPGPAQSMSRRQPDGRVLSWRLTNVPGGAVPALLPFLIDWGDSPHPSQTAPEGVQLVSFHITSPNPDGESTALDVLSQNIRVEFGMCPHLTAVIAGPTGTKTLD